MKKRDCTIRVAKTKMLISFTVNCEADLRLCFRIYKIPVFLCHGTYKTLIDNQ